MQQAQYAIGALIDSVGRLAVCSEYVAKINKNTQFSLSVENYMFNVDKPFESLIDKLAGQLGIEDDQLDNLYVIASGSLKPSVTRKLSMYVFGLRGPVTLRINRFIETPLRFMSFEDIEKEVDNNQLKLSFCGELMRDFISIRKLGVLKNPLNGKTLQKSSVYKE